MSEAGRDGHREPATDDSVLLERVASGSVESLGTLYDRHAAPMFGVAVRVLGSRRDAEDLLHDVFLEVWKRSASYDPARASVRTWLLVKVRSRAIDRLRSLAVARRLGLGNDLDGIDVEDIEAHLGVLRGVDCSRALDALAELPEAHRTVVQMLYLHGLSYSEIAAQCGLPIGTVKSRVARGLALLRHRLPGVEGAS